MIMDDPSSQHHGTKKVFDAGLVHQSLAQVVEDLLDYASKPDVPQQVPTSLSTLPPLIFALCWGIEGERKREREREQIMLLTLENQQVLSCEGDL